MDSAERNQMKLRSLNLLAWVYNTDPETIDTSEEYSIPRGEGRFPRDIEEQKRYLGYALKKTGRRNPVANLATVLTALSPKSKHHMIYIFIELSEADIYIEQKHTFPPLLRLCSFLQYALNERLETEQDLSPLIRESFEKDELSLPEVKLAQFIRHCRNDISHNFWHRTEWSFIIHNHASISTITLLNSLLESWYGIEWYVNNRINMSRSIRVIEDEFGLEWDSENSTYEKSSLRKKYDSTTDSATPSKTFELLEEYYDMK